MREWLSCALGELISLEYGSALGAEERTGEGYPVFGSNGVVGRHSMPLVSGPGIVVGRKGSAGALTWSDSDFWPIDTTYWVKPKIALELRWAYDALRRCGLERLHSSTGVPGLNRDDAYERRVPVPPVEEQRRIAEILDTIDETIHTTERVIAKKSAVLGGLSAALFASEVQHERLAELSRRITYGFTNPMPTVPTGPLMLTAADVGYRKLLLHQARRTSDTAFRELLSDKSRPSTGDILVTKDGTLGRVAVLGSERACVNQSVAVISLVDPTESDFIAEYLLSPMGQQALLAGAGGSTIKHLYISTMANLEIPWPDAAVRSHIVGTLRSVVNRIDGLRAEVEKLRRVRTGLAADLLSGSVRTVSA